jgi:mycoredoxin
MTAEIKMYGADWCSVCSRTEQYLVKNDVRFSWIDVEADPVEVETVMSYNGGSKNIPVVVFPDGTHLTEPTDADMDAKLGR